MDGLKGAIVTGFKNLRFAAPYIANVVALAHAEEQRQFRQNPGKPADVRIPIGGQSFYMGLTVAPNAEALEVRLIGHDEKTICSLSRGGELRFGKSQHVVNPDEAVQEFITKAVGRKPRYDFLQEVY